MVWAMQNKSTNNTSNATDNQRRASYLCMNQSINMQPIHVGAPAPVVRKDIAYHSKENNVGID
jgi:hypothetical protein